MADLPDLSTPRRVHLIGAGGAGMSAIATVLAAMGHRVTGSDAASSRATERLAALGVDVHLGHSAAHIGDADLVARSTAVPDGNPEVAEAARRGLRVWKRSEILASICSFKRVIAVSGTHGKTTTSAMLAVCLRDAGLHPSAIVGGEVEGLGGGALWDPAGEWLVVEADESDGTFLELGAEAVVVTSVEPDHLEYFGGVEQMEQAFARFVATAPGPAVVCADDPGAVSAGKAARDGLLTYGTSESATVRVDGLELDRYGSSFQVSVRGQHVCAVHLQVPGVHNARNAAAALSLSSTLGVTWEDAAAAVGGYRGVRRRFELRGERGGVTFVDEYAHLPGEVSAALEAAYGGHWKRIVAVFQPHRYSRTEALWQQFASSFTRADVVIVTDIYPAGEPPRAGVSGELVHHAVREHDPDADVSYERSLDEVESRLRQVLRSGDLCLTLGAGDVTVMADRLLRGEEHFGD